MTARSNDELTAQSPARELDEAELSAVGGGAVVDAGGGEEHALHTNTHALCGYYNYITKVITYHPCPRCKKPMHSEWYNVKWYCDPCDYSEFLPGTSYWYGTQEELTAAAS